MPGQFSRSYTSDHVIADDGTVSFACSTDTAEWPWLTLGPRHPVTVQALNFWTSVGAILALGGMEEGQWSALTWTDWRCGDQAAELAVCGVYSRETSGEHERYVIDLFDTQGRDVVRMRGRGVIFRNRNFEQWRERSKKEAQQALSSAPFPFAPPASLGIGAREHSLVGLPDGDAIPALVSRENGLPPANPMLGGSGDHVNSVHMIEAARQALCLLTSDPEVAVSGGEMELNRYVELGAPFRLIIREHGANQSVFALEQLDRECAVITLRT